jgi:uncharacterized membrane protein YccF (DUF307 family)
MSDVQSGLVDRALSLVSDQALTIAAVAVVGIIIGVATTQIGKLATRAIYGVSKTDEQKQQRAVMYRLLGLCAGMLWTFFLEWSVLVGAGKFAVASGVAIIAGGFTPAAYDAWNNQIMPKIKRWFGGGGGGGPPSSGGGDDTDNTMTSFKS